MGRVPGESTSSGQSTWAAQSSECSLGEKCEDERRSRSPLGCSVAGVGPGPRDASTRSGDHRQARGHFLPPKGLLPPSHLSVLKTTEEMQISFFAIRFFWLWVNLELEMLPADHGTFYIRCQAYLRLAKMGLSSLLFRSPCTATFCPSTATPGFDCLCSVLLGGWQTPPGVSLILPGLKAAEVFLEGCTWALPMGAAPTGTTLPVTGSLGSWGSRTLPRTPPLPPEGVEALNSGGIRSQIFRRFAVALPRGSGGLHLKAIAIFKTLQVHSTFLCLGAQDHLGAGGTFLGFGQKWSCDPAPLVPSA